MIKEIKDSPKLELLLQQKISFNKSFHKRKTGLATKLIGLND